MHTERLSDRIRRNDWYRHTVQQMFARTCDDRGDFPALYFDGRFTSFRELHEQVDALTAGLVEQGIGAGDVVSVLPSPTPEFVVVYFAVLQTGATFNALNLLWGTTEFAGVIKRNAPKMIISVDEHNGRDYARVLREATGGWDVDQGRVRCAAVPSLERLVCVARKGPIPDGFTDIAQLSGPIAAEDRARIRARVEASQVTDVQFICQTSGSTGLSKSALWNHRSPLATANYTARYLGLDGTDRYINLSPFFHNSGICASMTMCLAYAGITLYLTERFVPAEALELVAAQQITATFGFDAHWQGLRRDPSFSRDKFTISKALIAGEPKTYELCRSMCPADSVIANLYAQTENGPMVAMNDFGCVDERINKFTNGRPLPGVEVVIKEIETGRRLPQGEAGEICYKSPFLFVGYLQQDDEYQRVMDDEGYLHSGDFGMFDGGYITFLGRLGGVVKSGGENVSTLRVSALLLDVFADEFDDVQTIGVEDDYWGSKVVTFVRPKPGVAIGTRTELRARCKGAMADYEIPQEFLPWEGDWPASPEGKLDVRLLRSRVSRS